MDVQATFLNFWSTNPELVLIDNVMNGDCRLVGGCVRDILIGETPKDIDLATPWEPERVAGQFSRVSGAVVIPTGIAHGTVTLHFPETGNSYEITTLRYDTDTDGRHATVQFHTDFREDALRRDFTINAMSVDRSGRLFDYFGGFDDLQNGRVRFVGKAVDRIREDYLRILRYFRFLARFGSISAQDAYTLEAIRENAHGLKQISGERIWSEIKKIVSHDRAIDMMGLMASTQVLDHCGMETWAVKPNAVKIATMEHVMRRTRNPVSRLVVFQRMFGALDGAEAFEIIFERFRMAADERDLGRVLVDVDFVDDVDGLKRQIARDLISHARAVEWIAVNSIHSEDHAEIVNWKPPVFPVRGKDLLKLMEPGKIVGVWMNRLREEWIASEYKLTKDELLAQVTT